MKKVKRSLCGLLTVALVFSLLSTFLPLGVFAAEEAPPVVEETAPDPAEAAPEAEEASPEADEDTIFKALNWDLQEVVDPALADLRPYRDNTHLLSVAEVFVAKRSAYAQVFGSGGKLGAAPTSANGYTAAYMGRDYFAGMTVGQYDWITAYEGNFSKVKKGSEVRDSDLALLQFKAVNGYYTVYIYTASALAVNKDKPVEQVYSQSTDIPANESNMKNLWDMAQLVTADVTGDGCDEIICSYPGSGGLLTFKRGEVSWGAVGGGLAGPLPFLDGDTQYNAKYLGSDRDLGLENPRNTLSLAVGDINRDGCEDIVYVATGTRNKPFAGVFHAGMVLFGRTGLSATSSYGRKPLPMPSQGEGDDNSPAVGRFGVTVSSPHVTARPEIYLAYEKFVDVKTGWPDDDFVAKEYCVDKITLNKNDNLISVPILTSAKTENSGHNIQANKEFLTKKHISALRVAKIDNRDETGALINASIIINGAVHDIDSKGVVSQTASANLVTYNTNSTMGLDNNVKVISTRAATVNGSEYAFLIQFVPEKSFGVFTSGKQYIRLCTPGGGAGSIFDAAVNSDKEYMFCALPDVDNDSIYLRYDGYSHLYSDPVVVAALVSPPYFEDLRHIKQDYKETSETRYAIISTTGQGTESSKTVNVGAYVAAELAIGPSVAKAVVETEVEYNHGWTEQTQEMSTISYTSGFITKGGQDSVVMHSTPLNVYSYTMYVPKDDKGATFEEKPYNVVIPDSEGLFKMIPLEGEEGSDAVTYNKLREKYGSGTGEGAYKLDDIGKDVFSHTLGQPQTYLKGEVGTPPAVRGSVLASKEWFTASNRGATESIISMTKESVSTTTGSNSISAKLGGGFVFEAGPVEGRATAGVTGGAEWSSGEIVVDSSTTELSARLDGVPTDAGHYGYEIKWRLMTYIYDGENYQFPVVTYVVDPQGVSSPPRLPAEFIAKNVERTSITLSWPASTDDPSPGGSEVKYNLKMLNAGGVDLSERYGYRWVSSEKRYEMTVTGLSDNTQYDFTLSVTKGGRTSPDMSLEGIWTRTEGDASFTTHPGNITLETGKAGTLTAIFNKGSSILTQLRWEKYNETSRAWETVATGSGISQGEVDNATAKTITKTLTFNAPVYTHAGRYRVAAEVTYGSIGKKTFSSNEGRVQWNTSPPPKPVGYSSTHTQITINEGSNPSSLQYGLSLAAVSESNITWQNSNIFTGLKPNTEYYLYHRYKLPDGSTSGASPYLLGITKAPPLTGTVTITGNTVPGGVLTANVNITGSMWGQWGINPQSNLKYFWNGSNVPAGNTYTVKETDFDKTVTVRVASPLTTGSLTGTSAKIGQAVSPFPVYTIEVFYTEGMTLADVPFDMPGNSLDYAMREGLAWVAPETEVQEGNHEHEATYQVMRRGIGDEEEYVPNEAYSPSSGTIRVNAAPSSNITLSGYCGHASNPGGQESVQWHLVVGEETGELTFTGTGKMEDFSYYAGTAVRTAPWVLYKKQITSVTVDEGITSVGDYACYGFSELSTLELPSTLLEIGASAFTSTGKLSSDILPEGLQTIKRGAFSGSGLTSIKLPESVISIKDESFYGCRQAKSVYLGENLKEIGSAAISNGGNSSLIDHYELNPENPHLIIGEHQIIYSKDMTTLFDMPQGYRIPGEDLYNGNTLILPDTVKKVQGGAFLAMRGVNRMVIPASVAEFGARAFESALREFVFLRKDGASTISESTIFNSFRFHALDTSYPGHTAFVYENSKVHELMDSVCEKYKVDLHFIVDTVEVAEQQGSLTAGTPGSATFAVERLHRANAADGEVLAPNTTAGVAIYLNNLGNVPGISLGTHVTASGDTQVTIRTSRKTPAGTHPLSLTIGGLTSQPFNLTVDEAPAVPSYGVTVFSAGEGYTGTGCYTKGAVVNISAGTPPPGMQFDKWIATEGAVLRSEISASTQFEMPEKDISVMAIFKPSTPTVTGVTVAPASLQLKKGTSHRFNALVTGTNAPPQTVGWSVEGSQAGSTIAQDGTLTIAAGETAATLTVKAASTLAGYTDKVGQATVTVIESEPPAATVSGVTVAPFGITLVPGYSFTFNANVEGENGPSQEVTWLVEGARKEGTTIAADGTLSIAMDETATNLTVRAVSAADEDKTGTAVVAVLLYAPPSPVSGVVISGGTAINEPGGTLQLSAVVSPDSAADKTVTWSITEGGDKAYIDPTTGLLTAMSNGQVTVCATSNGVKSTGYPAYDEKVITISKQPVVASSLAIKGGDKISTDRGTLQLTADIAPSEAAEIEVEWALVAGQSHADINEETGLLSAKSNGAVTVRAAANDGSGLIAEHKVTISNQRVKITDIQVNGGGPIVEKGGTRQLEAVISPENATEKNVTWTIESGAQNATLSETGLLTAKHNGTVTVRATAKDGTDVYGEATITISGQLSSIAGLKADPPALPAEGGMVDIQVSGIAMTNNTIVGIFDGSDYPLATASAGGTAITRAARLEVGANEDTTASKLCTVRASLDGGGTWSAAACTVRVAKAAPQTSPQPIALAKSMVRLVTAEQNTVAVKSYDPSYRDQLEVVVMETELEMVEGVPTEVRGKPKTASVYLSVADNFANEAEAPAVTVSRKAGQTSAVYVRVRYKSHPDIYAECRVEADSESYAGVPAAQYALAHVITTKATAYTRAEGGADYPAATIQIWHETPERAGEAKTRPLKMEGATVEFADGASPDANKYFSFTPLGEDTLLVNFKTWTESQLDPPANKRKFTGNLIITPAGGEPFITRERVTLTVSTATPKLKATAIKFNTFYTGSALSVDVKDCITGATVRDLHLEEAPTLLTNEKKARVNAETLKDWVNYDPLADRLTLVKVNSKMGSRTLSFEAELEGWTDKVPVAIKVSSAAAAPGLKLAATSGKLYAEAGKSDPLNLRLVSRSKKVSYDALGVKDLVIADKQSLFHLSFDPNTGNGYLSAKENLPENAKKYTVNLLAKIDDTPDDGESGVRLKYTVNVVKAGSVVKLKPSVTSVTLNPALAGGDMATVRVAPSIAGYNLSYGDIDLQPLKANGKKLGPDETVPFVVPDGRVDANGRLTIRAPEGADNGTWKLRLQHPSGQKADVKVVLSNKAIMASAKVKGTVDLTNGKPATITVSFKNYAEAYVSRYTVAFYRDSKCTREAENALQYTASGNVLTITPAGDMAKGTYYAKVSGVSPTGAVECKPVRISVTAPKPKLAQSTKKVTMYRADQDYEAVIKLAVPEGTKPIDRVEIKAPGKGKTSADTGYKIVDIGGGYYAIRFVEKPTASLPKKSTGLTLEVYLEGNTGIATTAKVTVAVK